MTGLLVLVSFLADFVTVFLADFVTIEFGHRRGHSFGDPILHCFGGPLDRESDFGLLVFCELTQDKSGRIASGRQRSNADPEPWDFTRSQSQQDVFEPFLSSRRSLAPQTQPG